MLMLELARSFEGRFFSCFPRGLETEEVWTLLVAGSLTEFSDSLEVETEAAGAKLCLLEAGPRVAEGNGRELFRFLLA